MSDDTAIDGTGVVRCDGGDAIAGSVSRRDLQALVDEWRQAQDQCDLPRSGLTDEGYVYKKCADELEELISS